LLSRADRIRVTLDLENAGSRIVLERSGKDLDLLLGRRGQLGANRRCISV
jgi:hypothetical protein